MPNQRANPGAKYVHAFIGTSIQIGSSSSILSKDFDVKGFETTSDFVKVKATRLDALRVCDLLTAFRAFFHVNLRPSKLSYKHLDEIGP